MTLFVLTLISSILFPLSLPNALFPYGNVFLSIISLSFYYLALLWTPNRKAAIRLGMLFGAVSTAIANYWLMFFGQFSLWTLGGTVLGYIGYNAMLAPILRHFLHYKRAYRPFLFALVWTAYEYLKSSGFLGYPFGLAAYPLSSILPLAQHIEITGMWSLSFLAAGINAVVGEAIYAALLVVPGSSVAAMSRATAHELHYAIPAAVPRPAPARLAARQAIFFGLVVAVAMVYGLLRLASNIPVTKRFQAVLVQQNSDSWVQGNEFQTLRTAETLATEGIRRLKTKPDIVVFSETSLYYPYAGFDSYRREYETQPAGDPFVPFIRRTGTYLLTGAPFILDNQYDALNATLLINPRADVVDVYGKQHPVPFAESFPFWEVPAVRDFVRSAIGLQAMWVEGTKYTMFTIPLKSGGTLKFGTPICFEDSFPYIARHFVLDGADVLINLTNNSWSHTDSAQIQHFVGARLRAIENRRTLVRSTNSGLTAVVDAYGRTIAELPMFVPASLATTVPVYETKRYTPYTLFGDYLPIGILGLLLGLVVAEAIGLVGKAEAKPEMREPLFTDSAAGRINDGVAAARPPD